MKTKKVYILLTDTGTLFTRLIKLYTKKPYNHASIALESHLSKVYSFGRKTNRNPFVGGFVSEDLSSELFVKADCAIYSIEVTEDQLEMMNTYIRDMEAQKEQYSYNLIGLLGFLVHKPITRKKSFFCSQFVATVLKKCNIHDLEKAPSLIAPDDFRKTSNFQLVYEGRLKNFMNGSENVSIRTNLIPVEM